MQNIIKPENLYSNPAFSFFAGPVDMLAKQYTGDENHAVKNAVLSRKQEFMAGRVAARKSMAAWGAEGASVPVGKNRMPVFPQGIVGSISHAGGYAAAITAKQTKIQAVGLDIEQPGKVTPDLWSLLFSQDEINHIEKGDAAFLAALFFSAKEAFFKMQFPQSLKMMDFTDIKTSLAPSPNHITITGAVKPFNNCTACYSMYENLVCTLVYLPGETNNINRDAL